MKVVKRYEFPLERQISAGDITYNMLTISVQCCKVYLKVAERVNSKSLHHKKKSFSSFFYLCEMITVT